MIRKLSLSKKDIFKKRLRSSSENSKCPSASAQKRIKMSTEDSMVTTAVKTPQSFVFSAFKHNSNCTQISFFVVHTNELIRLKGRMPRIVDKLVLSYADSDSFPQSPVVCEFLKIQDAPLCFVIRKDESNQGEDLLFLASCLSSNGKENKHACYLKDATYMQLTHIKTPSLKVEGMCTANLKSFMKDKLYTFDNMYNRLLPFPTPEPNIVISTESNHAPVLIAEHTIVGDNSKNTPSENESDVNTFIFLDLETTGFRPCKISEICLCAVKVTAIDSESPSIDSDVEKLLLVVDPVKQIRGMAQKITKLSNAWIKDCNKPVIDKRIKTLVSKFLKKQEKPLCFIAHNGTRFDFPVLRDEFCKDENSHMFLNVSCVDSIKGFRQVVNRKSYSLSSFIEDYCPFSANVIKTKAHTAEFDTDMLILISRKHPEVIKWFNLLKCPLVQT